MNLEYTLDFKNDYKNTILEYFFNNKIDVSSIEDLKISELSVKFHNYQKSKINESKLDENTSTDAIYSSNMMIKWLNYLESEVKLSIDNIIEMAKNENVKIKKFPLHFELQLDIESKSYQVIETKNNFNINL